MKKLLTILLTIIGIGTLAVLTVLAGTVDRKANAKTYDLHGTYDGKVFTTDKNEKWNFETDILEYEAWNHDGEIWFHKKSEDYLYRNVTEDTLVYVRINDNGTDTLKDDYPVLVGYDWKGNTDKRNAEFDAWIEKMDAWTTGMNTYLKGDK